jgi:hypothetical protein
MSGTVLGYKVRNKKTGLYMKNIHSWTKKGRIWSRRSDIFRSINYQTENLSGNLKIRIIDDAITNWEIVELVESSVSSFLFDLDRLNQA